MRTSFGLRERWTAGKGGGKEKPSCNTVWTGDFSRLKSKYPNSEKHKNQTEETNYTQIIFITAHKPENTLTDVKRHRLAASLEPTGRALLASSRATCFLEQDQKAEVFCLFYFCVQWSELLIKANYMIMNFLWASGYTQHVYFENKFFWAEPEFKMQPQLLCGVFLLHSQEARSKLQFKAKP